MFKRARTIEVISHPYVLNDNIVNQLIDDRNKKLTNKKNKYLIKDLPRNAIIAQLIDSNERIIAIPFFSSHISLPLKPGEDVWIYKEEKASEEGEEKSIEYFWMSRIHGMNFYEDVNFTHEDRKFLKRYEEPEELKSSTREFAFEKNINDLNPVAQFNDGPVYNTSTGNIKNPDSKQNVNNARLNISGQYFVEDIPRYTKNPGDLVIQGSNNTLIKLGNSLAIENNEDISVRSNSLSYSDFPKYSGAIDIVAGRAAISKELLTRNEVVGYHLNKRELFFDFISKSASRNGMLVTFNERGQLENIKDSEYYIKTNSQNIAEGDTDFYTDISRLYVSEYCEGDKLINYSNVSTLDLSTTFGEKKESTSKNNRGFIIAKSDEIRIVSRGNVFNVNREKDKNNNMFSVDSRFQETGGSIKIIKEGNSDNIAYLSLEHDGVASLNGSKIVIGDENKKKENGKSEHVYIGHGAKEPLVLGYFLKNKLENFMNEVCKSLILISKNLQELNDKHNAHFHPYAGVAGNTLIPNVDNLISDFKNVPEVAINSVVSPIIGSIDNETGEYGPIQGLNQDPQSLDKSIENILRIKDTLVETLSTIGRTL